MPAGDQVTMPRWVPTGIHMQHDIIKHKIKHVAEKKYSDFGGGKKNNLIQSFCYIT
jgi:hypothetical protein